MQLNHLILKELSAEIPSDTRLHHMTIWPNPISPNISSIKCHFLNLLHQILWRAFSGYKHQRCVGRWVGSAYEVALCILDVMFEVELARHLADVDGLRDFAGFARERIEIVYVHVVGTRNHGNGNGF
jgi:hypothetical protein